MFESRPIEFLAFGQRYYVPENVVKKIGYLRTLLTGGIWTPGKAIEMKNFKINVLSSNDPNSNDDGTDYRLLPLDEVEFERKEKEDNEERAERKEKETKEEKAERKEKEEKLPDESKHNPQLSLDLVEKEYFDLVLEFYLNRHKVERTMEWEMNESITSFLKTAEFLTAEDAADYASSLLRLRARREDCNQCKAATAQFFCWCSRNCLSDVLKCSCVILGIVAAVLFVLQQLFWLIPHFVNLYAAGVHYGGWRMAVVVASTAGLVMVIFFLLTQGCCNRIPRCCCFFYIVILLFILLGIVPIMYYASYNTGFPWPGLKLQKELQTSERMYVDLIPWTSDHDDSDLSSRNQTIFDGNKKADGRVHFFQVQAQDETDYWSSFVLPLCRGRPCIAWNFYNRSERGFKNILHYRDLSDTLNDIDCWRGNNRTMLVLYYPEYLDKFSKEDLLESLISQNYNRLYHVVIVGKVSPLSNYATLYFLDHSAVIQHDFSFNVVHEPSPPLVVLTQLYPYAYDRSKVSIYSDVSPKQIILHWPFDMQQIYQATASGSKYSAPIIYTRDYKQKVLIDWSDVYDLAHSISNIAIHQPVDPSILLFTDPSTNVSTNFSTNEDSINQQNPELVYSWLLGYKFGNRGRVGKVTLLSA